MPDTYLTTSAASDHIKSRQNFDSSKKKNEWPLTIENTIDKLTSNWLGFIMMQFTVGIAKNISNLPIQFSRCRFRDISVHFLISLGINGYFMFQQTSTALVIDRLNHYTLWLLNRSDALHGGFVSKVLAYRDTVVQVDDILRSVKQ